MYAIVETSGKQYRVEPGAELVIDRINAQVGSTIELDRVLLIGGESLQIGAPTVAGAKVKAEVASHDRGDKCITFKYTRTRRKRVRRGFRSSLTTLKILCIEA